MATVMLLSLVFLAAFPLALGMAPVKAATTWNVSMYGDSMSEDYEFIPAIMNISVGDSVNWTSAVGTHTTTSGPNQAEWWDSGAVTPGSSFVHTFTLAGTYSYSSLIDPQMYGTVVVQQPTPEFPGFVAISTVAMAVILGLLVERKLKE